MKLWQRRLGGLPPTLSSVALPPRVGTGDLSVETRQNASSTENGAHPFSHERIDIPMFVRL